MTIRYVGLGGNDGNNGLTWALRKLTLNGVEDTPVVVGDVVWVGPGVYREQLDVDVAGGNTYSVGTVSVTDGSTTVTGAGTAFLANVGADYQFHVAIIASGNDGVTNGTATFTSVAGNFQASMIGKAIQIMTKGAYIIAAVAAANSITLADPSGLGWPAAGVGLTYSVMSGEGHYEILSITDNTNFELKRPWNGPTLTGIAYITFEPITYIADVTGENTDGVGGIVRITASDDDQANDRDYCIEGGAADHYRVFRGFSVDMASACVRGTDCDHWVIEDFSVADAISLGIYVYGTNKNWTMRRLYMLGTRTYHIRLRRDAVGLDDAGHVVENAMMISSHSEGINILRLGGVTIRNVCLGGGGGYGVRQDISPNLGQTSVINNSIIIQWENQGLLASTLGDLIENYNTFFNNGVDRTNVGVGASSQTYPPLFNPPLLYSGENQNSGLALPWRFGELSEWSQVRAITGIFETPVDLFGTNRPVTASKDSWGSVRFHDVERETGTVRTGSVSIVLHDAGRHQIWVPVEASSTTIRVYVYREANYAGLLPQMIIKQPGVADRVTTDVGAVGGWNLLTDTFVPQAIPPYVVVELVSRNTNGAADETFFDDLDVS